MNSCLHLNKLVEIFKSDTARSRINCFSFSRTEKDAFIFLRRYRENWILDHLLISDFGNLMRVSLCAILYLRCKSQVEVYRVPHKKFHGTFPEGCLGFFLERKIASPIAFYVPNLSTLTEGAESWNLCEGFLEGWGSPATILEGIRSIILEIRIFVENRVHLPDDLPAHNLSSEEFRNSEIYEIYLHSPMSDACPCLIENMCGNIFDCFSAAVPQCAWVTSTPF